MIDIERTNEKLKDLYIKLCQDSAVYTKEETIELFEKYNFTEDDAIEIFPIEDIDCEFYDIDDEDMDDEELEDDAIIFSGDIQEDLEEYDDDQIFNIEFPEEIELQMMSDKFKSYLYSTYFNNEERCYIFEMLMNKTLELADNPFLTKYGSMREETKQFISSCGINDFVMKFVTNTNFCKFVFDAYTITLFDKNTKPNNKCDKITSINDLIREKFVLIHNKNVSNGTTDNDSALVILKYLNGNYNPDEINKIYKEQLGNYKIEEISDINYIKIIMITDYLRMCELKLDQYKKLDEIDTEYFDFITNSNIKVILNRFEKEEKFSLDIISEFIQLNLFCSDETKKSCKNTEKIKKLNPLYILDYM